MKEPEFNMISIYPLMDIQEIYKYNGPFKGVNYDSEIKVEIAREMARCFAEMKLRNRWDSYYPTNKEMNGIVKLVRGLMKRKRIIRAYPNERFRFASIIDYLIGIKDLYDLGTYEDVLSHKQQIIRLIADAMTN